MTYAFQSIFDDRGGGGGGVGGGGVHQNTPPPFLGGCIFVAQRRNDGHLLRGGPRSPFLPALGGIPRPVLIGMPEYVSTALRNRPWLCGFVVCSRRLTQFPESLMTV